MAEAAALLQEAPGVPARLTPGDCDALLGAYGRLEEVAGAAAGLEGLLGRLAGAVVALGDACRHDRVQEAHVQEHAARAEAISARAAHDEAARTEALLGHVERLLSGPMAFADVLALVRVLQRHLPRGGALGEEAGAIDVFLRCRTAWLTLRIEAALYCGRSGPSGYGDSDHGGGQERAGALSNGMIFDQLLLIMSEDVLAVVKEYRASSFTDAYPLALFVAARLHWFTSSLASLIDALPSGSMGELARYWDALQRLDVECGHMGASFMPLIEERLLSRALALISGRAREAIDEKIKRAPSSLLIVPSSPTAPAASPQLGGADASDSEHSRLPLGAAVDGWQRQGPPGQAARTWQGIPYFVLVANIFAGDICSELSHHRARKGVLGAPLRQTILEHLEEVRRIVEAGVQSRSEAGADADAIRKAFAEGLVPHILSAVEQCFIVEGETRRN